MTRQRLLALCLLLLALAGCAGLPSGVEVPPTADRAERAALELYALARHEHVTDARFQAVRGRCCLFVDLPLRYRMAEYAHLQGLQAKRALMREVLQRAARVGERAMGLF
ncbi:MAG: hypothetical protein D6786_05375, partial [Gammaproteobacteria bacterium]